MCFDSDAEIIAGTSLGGVKLLDHVTTYWDALDSTYTTVPTVTPTYRLDGYHTAVYTLVNHAIELHVHILTGLIYKLVALPGYGGKFKKSISVGMPIYQIHDLNIDIKFDDVESGFYIPGTPGILFEPCLALVVSPSTMRTILTIPTSTGLNTRSTIGRVEQHPPGFKAPLSGQ